MPDMMERVARIIDPNAFAVWDREWDLLKRLPAAERGPTFEQLRTIGLREKAKRKARAALQAMLEPTNEMIDAVDLSDAFTDPESTIKAVWRDMILKALASDSTLSS